jgi:hypothetical protein
LQKPQRFISLLEKDWRKLESHVELLEFVVVGVGAGLRVGGDAETEMGAAGSEDTHASVDIGIDHSVLHDRGCRLSGGNIGVEVLITYGEEDVNGVAKALFGAEVFLCYLVFDGSKESGFVDFGRFFEGGGSAAGVGGLDIDEIALCGVVVVFVVVVEILMIVEEAYDWLIETAASYGVPLDFAELGIAIEVEHTVRRVVDVGLQKFGKFALVDRVVSIFLAYKGSGGPSKSIERRGFEDYEFIDITVDEPAFGGEAVERLGTRSEDTGILVEVLGIFKSLGVYRSLSLDRQDRVGAAVGSPLLDDDLNGALGIVDGISHLGIVVEVVVGEVGALNPDPCGIVVLVENAPYGRSLFPFGIGREVHLTGIEHEEREQEEREAYETAWILEMFCHGHLYG